MEGLKTIKKRLLQLFLIPVSLLILITSCTSLNIPIFKGKMEKGEKAVAQEYYLKAINSRKKGDIYHTLIYLTLASNNDPKNKKFKEDYKLLVGSLISDISGTQEIVKKGNGISNPIIYKLYRQTNGRLFPVQGMPVHFKLINASGKITNTGITNDIGEAKCYIEKINNYTTNVAIEAFVRIPDNDRGIIIKGLTKKFVFKNFSVQDKRIKILLKQNMFTNNSDMDKKSKFLSNSILDIFSNEGFSSVSIVPSYNVNLFNMAINANQEGIIELGREISTDIIVLVSINELINLQQTFDFYLKKITIKSVLVNSISGKVLFITIAEGKGADRTEGRAEDKAINNALYNLKQPLKNYLEEVKIKNEFFRFQTNG